MSARNDTKELRAIFLDIDGVLNSEESCREHKTSRVFGKPHVEALNTIVKRTGAVLVVSSVWRLGKSVARLQCILNEQGVKGTVLDHTCRILHWKDNPRAPDGRSLETAPRGEEIQKWLDDRAALHPEEKVRFVILDDDRDMIHLIDRLVWTGAEKGPQPGLRPRHIEPAVKLLKGVTW